MNRFSQGIKDFIRNKLFRINDSPQKVAAGFGLGAFCGIIPGTGPLAALFLAVLFKVNRASALLASLLMNTWLSLVMFVFSVKLGSAILGLNWRSVYQEVGGYFRDSNWQGLLGLAFFKAVFPVMLGYFILSLLIGLVSYIAVLLIIRGFKRG
jgi:uncharacterized protein (DUF2062 family)